VDLVAVDQEQMDHLLSHLLEQAQPDRDTREVQDAIHQGIMSVVVEVVVLEKKDGQQNKITLQDKVHVAAEARQVLSLVLYNFMVVVVPAVQAIVQLRLLLILAEPVVAEMLRRVQVSLGQLIQAAAVQAEVITVVQRAQAALVLLLFVGKVLI
jgi:hypothetical protein